MTREEQNTFLSKEHAEAIRYMDNANETLSKAKKDGATYTDKKYVKTACGTAYNGVLLALDAWFKLKNIPEPRQNKHKSIEYYMSNIAAIDKKLASDLDGVYRVLHLEGYYHGITNAKIIKTGFDVAYEIIDRIKPENPVDIAETRGDKVKRVWNKMLISLAVMFR